MACKRYQKTYERLSDAPETKISAAWRLHARNCPECQESLAEIEREKRGERELKKFFSDYRARLKREYKLPLSLQVEREEPLIALKKIIINLIWPSGGSYLYRGALPALATLFVALMVGINIDLEREKREEVVMSPAGEELESKKSSGAERSSHPPVESLSGRRFKAEKASPRFEPGSGAESESQAKKLAVAPPPDSEIMSDEDVMDESVKTPVEQSAKIAQLAKEEERATGAGQITMNLSDKESDMSRSSKPAATPAAPPSLTQSRLKQTTAEEAEPPVQLSSSKIAELKKESEKLWKEIVKEPTDLKKRKRLRKILKQLNDRAGLKKLDELEKSLR